MRARYAATVRWLNATLRYRAGRGQARDSGHVPLVSLDM